MDNQDPPEFFLRILELETPNLIRVTRIVEDLICIIKTIGQEF